VHVAKVCAGRLRTPRATCADLRGSHALRDARAGNRDPDNAASSVLHSEGDRADDQRDAARGDNTDDKISSDGDE